MIYTLYMHIQTNKTELIHFSLFLLNYFNKVIIFKSDNNML